MGDFCSRDGCKTLNFNDFIHFVDEYQSRWVKIGKKTLNSLQHFQDVSKFCNSHNNNMLF